MKNRIIDYRNIKRRINLKLPRVGNIRIGKKSDKGYPMSVDYFIAVGKYESLFNKVYGDKPNRIQIMFPEHEDINELCVQRYEYRNDKGELVAYGDGQKFNVFNKDKYVERENTDSVNIMQEVEKYFPNRKVRQGLSGWDITLELYFLMPRLVNVMGLWRFSSKGIDTSIPNILNVIDVIVDQKGRLSGMLFDLSVEFAISNKPNSSSKYPVVTLIPNESVDNLETLQNDYNNNLKIMKSLRNE